MTSNVQAAADYWTADRENLGTRLCYWWAEKQRAKWRNSFNNEEIFWMNNKAIIEFGFRRIWKILQFKEVYTTISSPGFFSANSSIICHRFNYLQPDVLSVTSLFNMTKILLKFGQQLLIMVNYACGFNQSETGKYFEWVIIISFSFIKAFDSKGILNTL